MRTLGIVADDMTGACDVAGAFAQAGLRTVVWVGFGRERACGADLGRRQGSERVVASADVVVVDVDLRDEDEARVVEVSAAALAQLAEKGASVRMLKIDSTLRGPVAAMIASIADVLRVESVFVAPGFPDQGRFLVGGQLRLGSPDAPTSVNLLGALRSRGLNVTHVANPAFAMPNAHDLGDGGMARVVVFDSTSGAELAMVGQAWLGQVERTLLVGSAGVGRAVAPKLAAMIADESRPGAGVNEESRAGSRADAGECRWYLVVAGSPTEVTAEQLTWLASHAPTTELRVDADTEASEIAATHADEQPFAEIVVLRTPTLVHEETERDDGAVSAELAKWVVSLVRSDGILRRRLGMPHGVIIVGGATARRVFDGLHVEAVEVIGEVLPGMPIGRVAGGVWDGVSVVTKAGGFGSPAALEQAWRRLRREPA